MGTGDGHKDADGRLFHGGYWRDETAWPIPGTRMVPYYFHADGSLSPTRPTESKSSTTYTYDPAHPVPTVGGGSSARLKDGAYDQREDPRFPPSRPPYLPLRSRPDVLVFETAPLTEDLEVTGPISVVVFASSNRTDTDFTAKLIDVYPPSTDWPGGFDLNLTDAIIRGRYRATRDHAEFLTPGTVYEFTIDPFPDRQRVQEGTSHSRGHLEQQLSALRREPEHRRAARQEPAGCDGGQHRVSQRQLSVAHHPSDRAGEVAMSSTLSSDVSSDAPTSPHEVPRRETIGAVLRVASGNFLEMYDFIVYGYYATYIGKTFFPAGSEFASLMLSLMTFGVGYLMRPIGAVVLGAYIDRVGRRRGLIVTLGLMAIGTLTIAATPGYASIGLIAPVIIVVGRLIQGLSAGVELGGVSVYLAEIATPGHRGFYCSWQSASQQLAVVFTALLGLGLTINLTGDQMSAFGWRIPLIVGCLIIPIILWLRRSLEETRAFKAMRHHPRRLADVSRVLLANWVLVLTGMTLVAFTTTSFYLITTYTPTFGRQSLHLEPSTTFIVTLCVGLSNFIWLPAGRLGV